MTELSALLAERGIQKAVVIDDAFDAMPYPDELEKDAWTVFFDDLDEKGKKLLADLHPGYDDASTDDLRNSQDFISVVWEKQTSLLIAAACEPLFSGYKRTKATERERLEALVKALENLGLTCTKMGREINEEAKEADLIFADLFLGFHQSEDDMERAIRRVEELTQDRIENPPLVILMSSSSRILENPDDFRDKAGLLGSTFRVVTKANLAKDDTLKTILMRLARHYEDAKRVASFVHAWNDSLDQARENFIQILRRLDLSDLAQIQALLLDFEGQMLGEYLLDVADRVLQYEIEAQAGTISAAQELTNIDLTKYPTPHLAASPGLQDLVHRMIFQHAERLKLSFDGEKPKIQFGDVLRIKNEETGDLTNNVLLVTTPACDLVRCETKFAIMVLPGVLSPLSPANWLYEATMTKTPIYISSDGSRHGINWNLKGRYTIPLSTLSDLLHKEEGYVRLGRLREMYAIEIQQKLLVDMGRIGQPANPPATFPVSISLYVVSPEGVVRSVVVNGLDKAVCFVGRDEASKRVDHLVLGETACDALKGMIQDCSPDDVHSAAQESLKAMKTDLEFFERFEMGRIKVPPKDGKLQEEKGSDGHVYMHIFRNEWKKEGDSVQGNHRKGPFIIKIGDVEGNS